MISSVKRVSQGVTLAEVLIALALLGIIAAFTIPKIVQSQQQERTKAVIKSNVGELASLVQGMHLQNQLDEAIDGNWAANEANIIAQLNAVTRLTNVNPYNTTHPILPSSPCKPLTTCQSWDHVAAMPDGSVIGLTTAILVSGQPQVGYFFLVDGNGPAVPNESGRIG